MTDQLLPVAERQTFTQTLVCLRLSAFELWTC